MPKLNYPLNKYIKAVECIAEENGLASPKITPTKGSIVRFELFEIGMKVPMAVWTIHHTHNNKQQIWSKEDYKKAARNLCCDYEKFINKIQSF